MRSLLSALWVLLTALPLAGCGPATPSTYEPELSPHGQAEDRIYRIGVHPLHNPQRLMEVYGPLVDHLNAAMPDVELQLEASRNYEEYEKKLYAGEFAFAMPNPYQTVLAMRRGYHVIAKMGDDAQFRGLILVRRDSPVRSVQDLRGRTVAYPAPTALAATMLPQYYLHTHGLDVNREVQNVYVGSQESAIASVLRGHVAAAATWPVPWLAYQQQNPVQAALLEVRWQTEPLVNNSWMVREDVPPDVTQRFTRLLVGLRDDEPGRRLLQRLPAQSFEPASDQTYVPVRLFLQQFASRVRPIEQ